MKNNLTKMETALQKLTQREAADAFVIFSDNHSGRFIQFAGSLYENLLLDLPIQNLSKQELGIARELFNQQGVALGVTQLLDEPNGKPVGVHMGFNIDFGKDYQSAAKTALYLMCEVYSLADDFNLLVEEN